MSDGTTSAPLAWMPRERWDALVQGECCPLCQDDVAEPENPFSFLVAEMRTAYLRLGRNQDLPGYCALISKQHVREPHELSAADRAAFFEDMVRAGRALEQVFGAVKVNYQILGNAIPHLHCHITPRLYGDPYPGRPPDQDRESYLSAAEYARLVDLIRAALT
jgi:diadenosine tetraphosphate (Ap4A) HIT family hydrolase